MGHVTCGVDNRRCCWRCDRCPTCDGIGPLRRGDYCGECTQHILAHGGKWNPHTKDYDPDKSQTLFARRDEPDEIAAAQAYREQKEEEVTA